MDEIMYLHLNNWQPGYDYPNEEPFLTWFADDCDIAFDNDDWAIENRLCVARYWLNMSAEFCITTTRSWIENNCPNLLTDKNLYDRYIFNDKIDTEHPMRNGFIPYDPENFGTLWVDEDDDIIENDEF